MITNTQKETIDVLRERARGESEHNDNTFLIDIKGRIIGQGYWTPGSWFDWGSREGTEITVMHGTKVKDIREDVKLAKKACESGTYNIEYER